MSDLTHLIDAVGAGDRKAAAELLPLVYEELRKLAATRLAQEANGHTLEPTALVHEAFLRLVGLEDVNRWDNRVHFFKAAAEAMRRILIESARRKTTRKHGGERKRVELTDLPATTPPEDLLALDEALTRLGERDPVRAELVQLRFFGGLSVPEAANTLGISIATADRYWAFARAWLYAELNDEVNAPANPKNP